MSKPAPLVYATSPAFSSAGDPWDGGPTRVPLPGAVEQFGFPPSTRIPSEYLNEAIGVLADHTQWLDNVTTTAIGGPDAVDFVYEVPPTRTVQIPSVRGFATTSSIAWGIDQTSTRREIESRLDRGFVTFDLSETIPTGATVTRVRALVDPGAARPTGGDRVQVTCIHFTPDFVAPVGVPTTSTLFSATDDGTTSLQLVTSGVFAALVNHATKYMLLQVRSGSDGGTNRDKLYSIEVQWTDPGPGRNF